MGDLLADLGQLFPVHGNVLEAPVTPDLLRFELHEGALGILLVGLDARAYDGPQGLGLVGHLDVMLLQDVVQGIRRRPIVLFFGIQVFQRATHIEHDCFDHWRPPDIILFS